MSTFASRALGGRPQLRLVRGSLRQLTETTEGGWRRVASAILGSTWDVSRHLGEQRWGRVNEELSERRELLALMRAMQLDVDGRSCLRSLEEAAHESERAIAAMMGRKSG